MKYDLYILHLSVFKLKGSSFRFNFNFFCFIFEKHMKRFSINARFRQYIVVITLSVGIAFLFSLKKLFVSPRFVVFEKNVSNTPKMQSMSLSNICMLHIKTFAFTAAPFNEMPKKYNCNSNDIVYILQISN